MSADELARLKARAARCVTHFEACDCRAYAGLVVVQALRDENAALRAFAAALVEVEPLAQDWSEHNYCIYCNGDDATSPDCSVVHTSECQWAALRDWLAQSPTPAEPPAHADTLGTA